MKTIIDTHCTTEGDTVTHYALCTIDESDRREIIIRDDSVRSLYGMSLVDESSHQHLKLPGDVAWRVWDALTGKKS